MKLKNKESETPMSNEQGGGAMELKRRLAKSKKNIRSRGEKKKIQQRAAMEGKNGQTL